MEYGSWFVDFGLRIMNCGSWIVLKVIKIYKTGQSEFMIFTSLIVVFYTKYKRNPLNIVNNVSDCWSNLNFNSRGKIEKVKDWTPSL